MNTKLESFLQTQLDEADSMIESFEEAAQQKVECAIDSTTYRILVFRRRLILALRPGVYQKEYIKDLRTCISPETAIAIGLCKERFKKGKSQIVAAYLRALRKMDASIIPVSVQVILINDQF